MPMISKVRVSHIVTTRANITWSTDSPSPSRIHYGLTQKYDQLYEETPFISEHSIILTKLLKNKLYHFQVSAENTAHETAISEDYTFTTGIEDPFIILEENIITADERVRTGWQKLITVLPDCLNPQLDVMSGYLEAVRKRMQPTEDITVTTEESDSGSSTLDQSQKPGKKK